MPSALTTSKASPCPVGCRGTQMRPLLEDHSRSRQRSRVSRHHAARCGGGARMGTAGGATSARMTGWLKRHIWGPHSALGFSLAVLVFAVDRAFKWWMLDVLDIARTQPIRLSSFLSLVLAWNTGVSYGWFAQDTVGGQIVFAAIGLAASLGLWAWLARTTHPAHRRQHRPDHRRGARQCARPRHLSFGRRLLPSSCVRILLVRVQSGRYRHRCRCCASDI